MLKGAHFLIILQVIFGFNWLRFIVQYLVSNQPSYKEKKYIGTAETDFKHIQQPKTSFNLEHFQNDTELFKE